jgi:hypothetical protein
MAESEGGHKSGRRPLSAKGKRMMLVSAAGSIGLAIVLGIIFLPVLFALEGRPADPFYTLEGQTTAAETRVTVIEATAPRPFAELGVLLINGSSRHEGALNPDVPVGPVTYTDDDGDGLLSVGDRFRIQVGSGLGYVLLITLLDDPGGGGVGRYAWTT